VIAEKEGVVVLIWVGAALVERQAGNRGPVGGTAALPGHLRAVSVGEVRGADRVGLAEEVLADVEVLAVVARLPAVPLVARPAEVLNGRVGGVGYAVYLLPRAPATGSASPP
jgi:hypothetical protein